MALRIVVHAGAHLVRQPIAQSLAALDLAVRDFAELPDAVAQINEFGPTLFLMDADGMNRQWRAVAASLAGSPGGVGLVLLASRFTFEDAHDAQGLRVAAVIMKPWKRDEHAPRVLDIALSRRGLRARRAGPRLPLPLEPGALVRFSLPARDEAIPVGNIGEGGVSVIRGSADAVLVPGERFPAATLDWEKIEAELSFTVVHQSPGSIGLRFPPLYTGRPDVVRELRERLGRALGSIEKRRRW